MALKGQAEKKSEGDFTTNERRDHDHHISACSVSNRFVAWLSWMWCRPREEAEAATVRQSKCLPVRQAGLDQLVREGSARFQVAGHFVTRRQRFDDALGQDPHLRE